MPQTTVTNPDIAALIERTEEAAKALIRGDVRRYVELLPHADDYTLMSPLGGDPAHGFDHSPASLDAQERFFAGKGEAKLEVVQTFVSQDMVVLALIERQHGEVGGLPEQDLSLRVTLVFRRQGSEWQMAHRHADPLVHGIDMDHLAALLRG